MRAIIKSKHQVFCNFINGFTENNSSKGKELALMKDELEDIFKKYLKQIEQLKSTLLEYGGKKKEISNLAKKIVMEKPKRRVIEKYPV